MNLRWRWFVEHEDRFSLNDLERANVVDSNSFHRVARYSTESETSSLEFPEKHPPIINRS